MAFTAVVAVAALWTATWVFGAMGSFLFLLLLAWLTSIAMEPAVLWLSARGLRRGLATGVTMLVMVLIFLGLGELFGSVFASQVAELAKQFPSAVTSALDWVNQTFHTSFDIAQIQDALQLTPAKLGEMAGKYGGGLLGVFGSLFTFLFDLLTILVFAYYFSADSPRLRQTIGSWLPQRFQRVFITVWTISVEKTGGYVISKLVLAALSAAFHVAFFWFIDVPFWLPLGVFAGIVGQFIPTIGTYIGVALPALFTLLDKPINAVWILIFATVYQQLENYVFTPRISRRTMDLHPAIALGSVIAGAALFGPIGALIGIPIAAVALSIVNTFSQRHELVPELADLEVPGNGTNGTNGTNGPDNRPDNGQDNGPDARSVDRPDDESVHAAGDEIGSGGRGATTGGA
ncbi:membrane protein [Intrasporangium oryzae NRRL B-24470]|uniref:Membrane protein n=1 Tax=Intrasporangium oryzae NRRL B-24470 TaxID=1386089 RepID=W9G775_9MICO|nr:membrane protein [Intrasporangium oryzae NRRL B-24470]